MARVGGDPRSLRSGQNVPPFADAANTVAAIEFLILTAARSGGVRKARWDGVDFETATWTFLPAG